MTPFSRSAFKDSKEAFAGKTGLRLHTIVMSLAQSLMTASYRREVPKLARTVVYIHASVLGLAVRRLNSTETEQLRIEVQELLFRRYDKKLTIEDAGQMCSDMWDKVADLRYQYFGEGANEMELVKPEPPKTFADCWTQLTALCEEQRKLRENLAATGTDDQYQEIIKDLAREQSL